MNQIDRFIASCASWEDFCQRAKSDGHAFERLVQLYLRTQPEYRTKLGDVWLLKEVPPDVRTAINLPDRDEGIDLIARDRRGEFWAIQAKFRSRPDRALNRRELGTFTALAFNTCRNIRLAVVAHTCSKRVSKNHLMRDTVEIGLDRWQEADWELIRASLEGKTALPERRQPLEHQMRALAQAKKHFIRGNAARGRLIMPCATGKSLVAFWIANDVLKAKTIVVAVPSLSLMRQTVMDWTREFLARGQDPNLLDWLCVCSDESVGNLERDEIVGEVFDVGLPTYTDPKKIAARLREPSETKIVFSTYHSSDTLAAAARRAKVNFDVIIFDEAHRTAGAKTSAFATLLRDKALKVRHRLFMTATERKINRDVNRVYSMDDHADIYGKRFFTMTYKEAIEGRIITDYKILALAVSDDEIASYITENRLLNLRRDLHEAEARAVATGIALKKVFEKHGITHALSFHSSIRAADDFREQQDVLNCKPPRTENFHISSKRTAGERKRLLDQFKASPRSLMTNARCLTEGVDVPAIDCVVFADPKQSATDIIQASGRAMRQSPGKVYGYILVPLVVPSGMCFDEFAKTTAFRTVVRIITVLSTHDERIVHELRATHNGRTSKGKIIQIDGKVPVGMPMSLDRFDSAVSTEIWKSVARVNWRPFEQARAFVRSLKLKDKAKWETWRKSRERPLDIPAAPNQVYANVGWVNWADWLGTRNHKGDRRPFEEARAYARSLGLKSFKQWLAHCKSGKLPPDIPTNPQRTYAGAGWAGWPDWLGTRNRKSGWRPFKDARSFARSLKLKSQEAWNARSGKLPPDIPKSPHTVYADAGWAGWGNWLGTGNRYKVDWRSFKDARAFARSLGFKVKTDWESYIKRKENPQDIPAHPDRVYAGAGWQGWGDWLGSGRRKGDRTRHRKRDWRPFDQARAYARRLKLKGRADWQAQWRLKKIPPDIPAAPNHVYANDGWAGWGDWLGTGNRYKGNWRSFNDARAFARSLKLKSKAQWQSHWKSGKRPTGIPAKPDRVYADAGWAGWVDWLGTGRRKGDRTGHRKRTGDHSTQPAPM